MSYDGAVVEFTVCCTTDLNINHIEHSIKTLYSNCSLMTIKYLHSLSLYIYIYSMYPIIMYIIIKNTRIIYIKKNMTLLWVRNIEPQECTL